MSEVPGIITDLVERFERNRDEYRKTLNETQTRIEFIDPFFEALGWDMANRAGYAEDYKDVIHEAAVRVGGITKAPDYCFRIGQTPKFFLEAKSPSTRIGLDHRPAYQLRRYAWNAKHPLAVLTNFDEFSVYDGRFGPEETDGASVARIKYIKYIEYLERWTEIAEVFAKEAILRGSFDRYAESDRGKRGTAPVDVKFLAEIEQWRESLAHNIALRNPGLSVEQLNFAVQKTIDRIIFLRMCEDRGIEQYGQLQGLCSGHNTYARLCRIYLDADDRYNSGLFHFALEKGRAEGPDDLTLSLSIDEKVLKDIIRRLYFPKSPYEFSVIPADILGNVYEQFLGKVIVVKSPTSADVQEKPEVKKAGGVYYTPGYIVDYIVKNTVGKLCEGKTPRQAAKLRILDPACGSGSFLTAAYTYLLDWHRDWYVSDGPEKHKKEIYQGHGGRWLLTTAEKKRILLANIYGVDIDSQAVEVTKLNLLLKVLEGETRETLHLYMSPMRERARALPDLGGNIKCGNSLVGPDVYESQQVKFLDGVDRYRINAFDWGDEFPQAFKGGNPGFDAVIGNPPYAYRNATENLLRPYYSQQYTCAEGNFDLYKFFIERNLSLACKDGLIGLITSATFLVQPSFEKLRRLLLNSAAFERLAPLGPGAFVNATVDTAIIVARRAIPGAGHRVLVQTPRRPTDLPTATGRLVNQSRFARNSGHVFDYRLSDEEAAIVQRLVCQLPSIETGYEFGVGINTGFIRDELVADCRIDGRYHPMVAGDGISRYGPVRSNKWIMYDKDYVRGRGRLGRSLPAEHLLSCEKILVVRTRNLSLPRRIVATLDRTGTYNLNRLSNIVARPGFSLPGLLGIVNSSLFNWLYSTRFYDYEIKPVYLRASPLANPNDPALVDAVEQLLALHKKLPEAKTPDEKTRVQRQIDAADRQIDALVYELYGLTKDEIELVEETEWCRGTGESDQWDVSDGTGKCEMRSADGADGADEWASRRHGDGGPSTEVRSVGLV